MAATDTLKLEAISMSRSPESSPGICWTNVVKPSEGNILLLPVSLKTGYRFNGLGLNGSTELYGVSVPDVVGADIDLKPHVTKNKP